MCLQIDFSILSILYPLALIQATIAPYASGSPEYAPLWMVVAQRWPGRMKSALSLSVIPTPSSISLKAGQTLVAIWPSLTC